MMGFLVYCGLLVVVVGVYFAVFWIFDVPVNYSTGIRFREWWRNRPTWNDPGRYARFKEQRGIKQTQGGHHGQT